MVLFKNMDFNIEKIQTNLMQVATITVLIIIFFLMRYLLQNTLITISFIASIFIIYIFPKSSSAQLDSLFGGYLIGSTIGLLFFYLNNWVQGGESIFIYTSLFCGMAVFLSTLLMSLFNCEHLPSVIFSSGLVLSSSISVMICLLVLGSFLILFISRELLTYLPNRSPLTSLLSSEE